LDLHEIAIFATGDYGKWIDRDIFSSKSRENINTDLFRREHPDVRVMCPHHDPFFDDLIINKLNRDMHTYTQCIAHAWCHVPSNSLKLLWNNESERQSIETIKFGLLKAWRMHTKDANATVATYHYDYGDFFSDSDDEYDGC
jgi:antirestriction protein